jgi:hypothetical protein
MPKRSRKKEKPKLLKLVTKPRGRDENQTAFAALQHVIEMGEPTAKNPMAMALGRLGGLKGGKARAAKMTKDQRSASAKRAAQARWAK